MYQLRSSTTRAIRASRVSLALAVASAAVIAAAAGSATRTALAHGTSTIASAVADPSRPETDRVRDASRKPAETLAFAGIKPGDKVADFIANTGYFTRLFSDLVGRRGHVYSVELNEIITVPNVAPGYARLLDWAKARPNVSVDTVAASRPVAFPEKLDVFWISQNYHDLGDTFLGPLDVAAFNRQVYAALRPGGLYIVLDHSALADSPTDVTETLHRIPSERVKREVEAAGFDLVAESDLLANPSDPRTEGVFKPSIVGHTDQFMLKFRRPVEPRSAAEPTPNSSQRDGSHDFDFNVGLWNTSIRRRVHPLTGSSQSIQLTGIVKVRKLWGGKAQLEEIEADGPNGHWEGMTLFLYAPDSHQWSQTFINSANGAFAGATTGSFKEGRGELYSQDTLNGRSILVRGVWSDITANAHRYEESYSDDGGQTWEPVFTASLTRKTS